MGATPWEVRPSRALPTVGSHVRSDRRCLYAASGILSARRGVEQRQLVGLITQRSGVRIPPPLPSDEALYGNVGGIFVSASRS